MLLREVGKTDVGKRRGEKGEEELLSLNAMIHLNSKYRDFVLGEKLCL